MMVLGVIYPIGALIEGAIAHVVGIRQVTVASGALLFVVMALIAVRHGRLFAALGEAEVDPAEASHAVQVADARS